VSRWLVWINDGSTFEEKANSGKLLCPASITLATQESEIRKMTVKNQPGQIFTRPYLKKTLQQKGWHSLMV
jgi:hypothetical protein